MLLLSNQNQLSAKAQKALLDIISHIQKHQPSYPHWYAGIATDPCQRLFSDHNVSKNERTWIFRNADSENGARTVEKQLLQRGCKGGTGGGATPHYVYAYIITSYTRE
jgi:hypothetical protein